MALSEAPLPLSTTVGRRDRGPSPMPSSDVETGYVAGAGAEL